MIAVFMGPPGGGKGTQAKRLATEFHLLHISTGDLLREAVAQGTEVGKRAKSYLDAGQLVPDTVMIDVIAWRLSGQDYRGAAIFDGFPRTLPQAEMFDQKLAARHEAVHRVYEFVVPEEILYERLSGRRICRNCSANYHVRFSPPRQEGVCDQCGGALYQREDDRGSVVRHRLKVYEEQTKALKDYYQKQGKLIVINAHDDIERIYETLKGHFRSSMPVVGNGS